MQRFRLIHDGAGSATSAYDPERLFHALQGLRACLDEVEKRCADDELLRDAATATLEVQRDQLSKLVSGYDRVRRKKGNGAML